MTIPATVLAYTFIAANAYLPRSAVQKLNWVGDGGPQGADRLLRTFRRDVGNQIVLGTFISTFLYCLLVLRTILGTDKAQDVPDLAVTFGVIPAVLSLAVLIYFVHRTAASIQVLL